MQKKLEEVCKKYELARASLHQTYQELNPIVEKMKAIEVATATEVAQATDVDGKKIYSNQLLREGEIQERLDTNEEYQTLTTRSKEIENRINALKAELDILQFRLRTYECIVQLDNSS